MKRIRQWLSGIASGMSQFLKYRKHIYTVPMVFIILGSLSILLAVLVYDRFLATSGEEVAMDFNNGGKDLTGVTIVLDPGHGGKDPGATSTSGLTEDEIVFGMAEKLRTELEARGATVRLTREGGEFVSLDDRKVEGDLFISLHSDAMDDPSISGFTTYYTHPEQEAFAQSINEALDRRSYFRNRGNRSFNYQVTWQLEYPAVLVELGYLSNEVDDQIITGTYYQDLMVAGIIDGIEAYLD